MSIFRPASVLWHCIQSFTGIRHGSRLRDRTARAGCRRQIPRRPVRIFRETGAPGRVRWSGERMSGLMAGLTGRMMRLHAPRGRSPVFSRCAWQHAEKRNPQNQAGIATPGHTVTASAHNLQADRVTAPSATDTGTRSCVPVRWYLVRFGTRDGPVLRGLPVSPVPRNSALSASAECGSGRC